MKPSWVPATFAGKCKVFPKDSVALLPYQRAWVEDESRLKICEKSRQIGWSWAEAFRICRKQSLKNAPLDHWVSSRDEIQAKLFLEDCKAFSSILQIGANDLGQQVVDQHGYTAYVLSFANGRRIHSMSSNADAQAGKRGGRTLDEFALHKDPRKLYTIAYPGITWGGDLAIFSTHRGTNNYFNQLITEIKHKGNPKGFSLHSVTLEGALDQGFLYKLQTKLPEYDPRVQMDEAEYYDFIREGAADGESFAEEYMCQPSDDACSFLSYELIDGAKYSEGEMWETDLENALNPLYVGVDLGRSHDLTVIWVIEMVSGIAMTRRVIEMRNETFNAQEAELYPLLDLPQVRRCCIDATGLGSQFAERARERDNGWKVEPITFTNQMKQDLAYPVKMALERKALRIPNKKEIAADLRSVQRTNTASGGIKFEGERTSQGHADRFWALSLALYASKSEKVFSATLI
ncbi:MAG: terminase family protein [Synechococcus sp.]|nr:terminase family protein [Synechococcus sp.]